MNAYNELVAKQLADVEEARKKHLPVKPIVDQNRQNIHAILKREQRMARIRMPFKRAMKWLKAGR